jgi:hypothetical protein
MCIQIFCSIKISSTANFDYIKNTSKTFHSSFIQCFTNFFNFFFEFLNKQFPFMELSLEIGG